MPDNDEPLWPGSVSRMIPTIGRDHLTVLAQIGSRAAPPVHPPLKHGEAMQMLLMLGKSQIPNATGGMNDK